MTKLRKTVTTWVQVLWAFRVCDRFNGRIHKKIKGLGYEYLYEPYQLSAVGSTISFVKDPDGYEIEIIQKN